jgi:hypothetical protein
MISTSSEEKMGARSRSRPSLLEDAFSSYPKLQPSTVDPRTKSTHQVRDGIIGNVGPVFQTGMQPCIGKLAGGPKVSGATQRIMKQTPRSFCPTRVSHPRTDA